MAMQLEQTIMQEIGLGQNYRWFNGSGSCEYIRQDAMRKLQATIQKYHDAGEQIAVPDLPLIDLARQASHWDRDCYELTIAWQVASEVIAAHIHGYHDAQTLSQVADYINKNYRPRSQKDRFRY